MNHRQPPADDSWESDPVWELLDQAQPVRASARFADDTVRAARMDVADQPWWSRWFAPAPLTGLAACAAAVALAFVAWSGTDRPTGATAADSSRAAEIQEIAETETLIAAVDQLEDFSDHELVTLIGF